MLSWNKQTDSFGYTDGLEEFNEQLNEPKWEIGFSEKRSSIISIK